MKNRLLEKNLIFYNPGKKGTVFTLAEKNYVDPDLIEKTIENLEYETEDKILFVEERRTKQRVKKM